jgi:transcriptional regulator with XRE-family HTH domain
MNQEPFYKRLRRLRLAVGLPTMAALANEIDVTTTVVQSWEQGKYRPTWENLLHLSRALRTPVEALMFGEEQWDVRDEWLARAAQKTRADLQREIDAIKAEAPRTPLYKPEGLI